MTGSSTSSGDLSIEMTGSSAEREAFLSLVIDRRTEPKFAKGLRDTWGLGETVLDTGVACLLGPNGSKDLKERNVGMPVGVFGDADAEDGDGVRVDTGEMFEVLLALLIDTRRVEGIDEGKALRWGCAGIDKGVWGERWVAMAKGKSWRNERSSEEWRVSGLIHERNGVITSPARIPRKPC
jgi:hypothetical protein